MPRLPENTGKLALALLVQLGNFIPFSILSAFSSQLTIQLGLSNLGLLILLTSSFSSMLASLFAPAFFLRFRLIRILMCSSFGITLWVIGYIYPVVCGTEFGVDAAACHPGLIYTVILLLTVVGGASFAVNTMGMFVYVMAWSSKQDAPMFQSLLYATFLLGKVLSSLVFSLTMHSSAAQLAFFVSIACISLVASAAFILLPDPADSERPEQAWGEDTMEASPRPGAFLSDILLASPAALGKSITKSMVLPRERAAIAVPEYMRAQSVNLSFTKAESVVILDPGKKKDEMLLAEVPEFQSFRGLLWESAKLTLALAFSTRMLMLLPFFFYLTFLRNVKVGLVPIMLQRIMEKRYDRFIINQRTGYIFICDSSFAIVFSSLMGYLSKLFGRKVMASLSFCGGAIVVIYITLILYMRPIYGVEWFMAETYISCALSAGVVVEYMIFASDFAERERAYGAGDFLSSMSSLLIYAIFSMVDVSKVFVGIAAAGIAEAAIAAVLLFRGMKMGEEQA